jgi:hypothetical protein
MPRGHIGMRFRRLRFRHSGKRRCNIHGWAGLHRHMEYVRTWFCLDYPFESFSSSDRRSFGSVNFLLRTIHCISIATHYGWATPTFSLRTKSTTYSWDVQWATLRRLVDRRRMLCGEDCDGPATAELWNRRNSALSKTICGTFRPRSSPQMEESRRRRGFVLRSRNDYETRHNHAENRETAVNVDIGEQSALSDHI